METNVLILLKLSLSELQMPRFQNQIYKTFIKGTAITILPSNQGEKQDCI